MISIISAAAAGFIAGVLHVMMGPDHLAAIAPLAVLQRRRLWIVGAKWGLGHATGVVIVGALALGFRGLLPTQLFSSHCERLVGVMLIAIGLWGLHKALRVDLRLHPHGHAHTAVAVGALHGLAGGSHFLGVLPSLAMPTRNSAVLYLLTFGIGTVVAMASFSVGAGYLGIRLRESKAVYFRRLMMGCSGVAIVVGGIWLSY